MINLEWLILPATNIFEPATFKFLKMLFIPEMKIIHYKKNRSKKDYCVLVIKIGKQKSKAHYE